MRKDRMIGEEGSVDRLDHDDNGKEQKGGRRAGQRLNAVKSFVLVALMVVTAYGLFNRGLFGEERWTPVAGVILVFFFLTLFIAGFYADITRIGWILVGLLATLVAVKGLSLTWTISPIETVKELLRSSMYLATFTLALAALSSRRVVPSFVDGMNVIVGLVASYGVLQKINPVTYPPRTTDGARIGSTIEYANTVALILAMGIVLGLGRMTQLKQPLARGLYASALLVFSTALYFTFSRGGILALGVGLVALFVLSGSRLQMFANLSLLAAPFLWLAWRAQDLQTLFEAKIPPQERLADGAALRTDLIIAVIAAFLLQAAFAVLVRRYELTRMTRRALGAAAIAVVVVGVGVGGYGVVSDQLSSGGITQAFTKGVGGKKDDASVNERLTSLSSNQRSAYWSVAWEEWKEHPLTGTGAGTFLYTWLEDRPNYSGVKQVHNVYLEQGTETGVVAFLALAGFAGLLVLYLARASLRSSGERRILLAAMTGASAVYLFHSAFEWHWYIPPSTLFFFVLAGVAAKLASKEDWDSEKNGEPA